MIGLFNVNKPVGVTSHDVVQRIRKLTGVRRVGHTGTLDPLASGVLIVLVGRAATRLARFLFELDKVYRATIRLGEVTPTYDTESEVIESHPVDVTRADIVAALSDFVGEIEQVPPMYSALKRDGMPLYALARQGKTVEREARQVTIYELALSDWTPPDLRVTVRCSTGTYIRSLAFDLGQALGCGAHLRTLVRTQVGHFELEKSHTPVELERLAAQNRLESVLLPPRHVFADKSSVKLAAEQVVYVRHGRVITLDEAPDLPYLPAYDPEGRLVAILTRKEAGQWHPTLVLNREAG